MRERGYVHILSCSTGMIPRDPLPKRVRLVRSLARSLVQGVFIISLMQCLMSMLSIAQTGDVTVRPINSVENRLSILNNKFTSE